VLDLDEIGSEGEAPLSKRLRYRRKMDYVPTAGTNFPCE
jgi:hypothetical protein